LILKYDNFNVKKYYIYVMNCCEPITPQNNCDYCGCYKQKSPANTNGLCNEHNILFVAKIELPIGGLFKSASLFSEHPIKQNPISGITINVDYKP